MEWQLGVTSAHPTGEIVHAAVRAEELGCGAVWVADIRFARECYVLMGAIAAATRHIVVGSSVSDAYSRHPASLAATVATLDEIAPGRIALGIGAGGSGMAAIAAERKSPLRTVETLIEGVRGLLNGDRVTLSCPAFSLDDAALAFVPAHRVPVAMAASGPLMYKLAGRIADLVFLGRYARPEGIDHIRTRLAEGLASRDRDLPDLREVWRIDISVSDGDPEAARTVMRDRTARLLRAGYRSEGFLEPIGLGELAETSRTLSAADVDLIRDHTSAAGTPSEVAARIGDVMTRARLDTVCLVPYAVPGQSLEDAVESTAKVAVEVGKMC